MILKILLILSTCTLGIFFGAQLTEAVLIVPYWKDLSANSFFELYKTYGKKIHFFYAPLTILATFFPISTLVYSLLYNSKTDFLLWLMAAFTFIFFVTYFLYFKEANIRFTTRAFSNDELPKALIIWGNWHWVRVVFEALALSCGIIRVSLKF